MREQLDHCPQLKLAVLGVESKLVCASVDDAVLAIVVAVEGEFAVVGAEVELILVVGSSAVVVVAIKVVSTQGRALHLSI